MEFYRLVKPESYNGLSKNAQTDFYRIANGIPLEGHGPERFLACKPPLRKNKDYRPRFRGFSFGFPIYKKDNYTRHLYNLQDIISDNHSPIMRYTKTFLNSYGVSAIIGTILMSLSNDTQALNHSLLRTNSNYTKIFRRFESSIFYYKRAKPYVLAVAVLATSFRVLGDHLVNSWGYSAHEAAVKTLAFMTPITIFLIKDRFYSKFWLINGLYFTLGYFFFYFLFINRNYPDTGKDTLNSTYIYLKSVTPEEQAKIEFQDQIEKFTRRFSENEKINIYDHLM